MSYVEMTSEFLYSPADHVRVKDLFYVQVIFLKIMAQVPIAFDRYLPTSLNSVARFLSAFYCFFVLVHYIHIALLYTKTTIDMVITGELELLTDALTMMIIYTFASFATSYFLYLSTELMNFLDRINRHYHHHSLVGLTYVSAYESYSKARSLSIYWLAACVGGTFLWALAPIILRSHTLPLSPWYPFDPLAPKVYEAVYVIQFIAQVYMGAIFGNCSALFATIALVLLGQFDVLFCSLKNLNFFAKLMSGEDIEKLRYTQSQLPMGDDDELNQYVLSKEHKIDIDVLREIQSRMNGNYKTHKQALHDGIVECIKHHRFVLESCRKLEEIFNPYCLVKSLQITVQLCLLVFRGVTGERSTVRLMNFCQYLALTFTELYILTYCGELLRKHSVRSGEAFWRSQWFTSATEIRKEIMNFLVNSRREVIITAGKFYSMDVQRFRSVITQAFSFYTLLRKMQAKGNNKNFNHQ